MKIQYASDLHLEITHMSKFEVLPGVKVLVLAGDIHSRPESMRKFLNKLKRNHPDLNIIVVLGNHEYYRHDFHKVRDEYRAVLAGIPDVHLLDPGTVLIDNVRFTGTTLYSDLSDSRAAHAAVNIITDFRIVKVHDHFMTPSFWTEEFRMSRRFLEEALAAHAGMQDHHIIVTHFMPSFSLVMPQFKGDAVNNAFVSNLEDLIETYKPTAWIYGHDHRASIDVMLGQTRMLCNQRGYHFEKIDYHPRAIVVEA